VRQITRALVAQEKLLVLRTLAGCQARMIRPGGHSILIESQGTLSAVLARWQ